MRSDVNVTAIVVIASACAGVANAATWIGPSTGIWTTPANWSGVVHESGYPQGADEGAQIDDNPSQATTVTWTLSANTSLGTLRIDAGDRFNLRAGTGGASAALTLTALNNYGTYDMAQSGGGNSGTGRTTIADADAFVNAAGAIFTATVGTGNNRRHQILAINAQNTNNGTINLNLVSGIDRNSVQLSLSGAGTFTNNGVINLSSALTGGSSSVQINVNSDTTFGGAGEIVMSTAQTDGAQILARSGSGTPTLTNGQFHRISGSGVIGSGDQNPGDSGNAYASSSLNIVNDGLINATGDTVALRIAPVSSVTNSSTGRLVATGAAGLVIGSSEVRTFVNDGTLEARSDSHVTITPTTVTTLGGEIRGAGTFEVANFALTGAATLSPGDSANSDGTGVSTVGALTVNGNLTLATATTLEFQLGDSTAAGVTYDTVNLAGTGNLTLAGIVNIAALDGFGVGTYRLFSFPGALSYTESDLVLGDVPAGFQYQLAVGSSAVDLVVSQVPEPTALVSIASLAMLGLRRRRVDVVQA